jgi:hypothetical protein
MLGGWYAERGLLGIRPHDQVGGEDPVYEQAAEQSAKQKLASRGPAHSGTYRGQLVLVPWACVVFDRSSKRRDVDDGRVRARRSALLLEQLREAGVLTESRTLALGEDGINEHELRTDRLGRQTDDFEPSRLPGRPRGPSTASHQVL